MHNERGYQYNFSEMLKKEMYDQEGREKKAKTMIAVLRDFLRNDLASKTLLDIGSSTGIIANYLAGFFGQVVGIDIDKPGIQFAHKEFKKNNLKFVSGDAINLSFQKNFFDVVICAHIYEHVPDAKRLMSEIYRVLSPGGVCYFAAGNRLNIYEPHYKLPFLSILPKQIGNIYLRLSGKGKFYYEEHLTCWRLKQLVGKFFLVDYNSKIILNPTRFYADYMIEKTGIKAKIARLIVQKFYWLCPTYIWLLQKTS